MEYIMSNMVNYKGESAIVGKKNKKQKETSSNITQQEDTIKHQPKQIIQISIGGVLTIIISVAIATISAIWILTEKLSDIRSDIAIAQTDMSSLNDDVSEIKISIKNMKDSISELEKWQTGVDTKSEYIDTRLNTIEEKINTPTITASNDIIQHMSAVAISRNQVNTVTSPFTSDTIIGSDTDGNEYNAKDLINETVLLTYMDDGKEVYFLGQFSDEYKWTGYCVTNVYNTDCSLYGICESNFDNGKRLDFKSIVDIDGYYWLYSKKDVNANVNNGINKHYVFTYDKEKNFSDTNVRYADIIYVDKLLESILDIKITRIYSGDTLYFEEEGELLYNDESGDAYLINCYDDGSIKTLYVGNFVKGKFNDDNAWEIVYSEDYDKYYYNVGRFSENKYNGEDGRPVNIEEINKIVSYYKFDCELKWRQ